MSDIAAARGRGCPKSMVYGPCGGVDDHRGCEVDGRPCPFCSEATVPMWVGDDHAPRPFALPTILVDVRPAVDDPTTLVRTAVEFATHGFGALLGEHLDDPDPARPHLAAGVVAGHGAPVIATVTPRDRSVADCATEIDALIAAGVCAVHCVTGDHPASRFGAELTARFSTDGTRLAALARSRGANVTVAESPASPPVDRRADRVLSKQRAGADAVILNHGGSVDDLSRFARRCRDIGVTMPLVAPVPVITDHRSAHALTQFPGLKLPSGLLESILDSPEPRRAGIDTAIRFGRSLLATGQFTHLNLSGSASGAGPGERVQIMAEVAEGIRGTT